MAGAQPIEPAGAPLVERLRAVHLEMVDAVLGGDGLGRVAQLAAEAAARRSRSSCRGWAPRRPRAAGRPTSPRCAATPASAPATGPRQVPPGVLAEVPIASGDEAIGCVLMLGEPGAPVSPEATEFLHLAAVASLTEVAVEEAKDEVEQNLRGSFLEELRAKAAALEASEVLRRAARLGCDVSRGAVALCAELTTDRPRHVVATIAGEHAGALAQHMELPGDVPRVYALLPAGEGAAPEATLEAARRLAARLQRHGTVGVSSFYSDPAEIGRAIQEAELVLDVLRRSEVLDRGAERHRHRHLPAAVPRARLAPRGGALVLRGHRRADRRLRRPVRDRPRRHARGLPRAELQHERDRGRDLRAPPHGRLPARARARS